MEYTMTPVQPEQTYITNEVIYAGFWRRCFARILDTLVAGAAGFVIVLIIIALASTGDDRAGLAAMIFMYGVMIFGGWLYFTLMESSKNQATLGKMAMGLRVTDTNGNRITWGRANARYFASFLSIMTLYIGFIMAAFTQKKQALHDMVAGTLVLGQQSSVPANIAQNAFQS